MTNRATYNIHDDRLKVWFAERLSPEDYEAAKAAGFVYWFGSKCLTCVWRPSAEDFIARFNIDIECTAEADDVAARVDRFDRHAGKAEGRADGAAYRLESGAANTERRQRLAEGVAAREFSKAEHWQRRIAAAIRHASFKEDDGAIYRRIETLEKQLRKHQTAQQTAQQIDEKCTDGPSRVWVGGHGRGAGYYRERSEIPAIIAYHARWCEHLGHRIEYEQARLAATGGALAQMAANEITIERGGAIYAGGWPLPREGWYFVTKLNPSSVEVWDGVGGHCRPPDYRKVTRDRVQKIGTPAQVESGEIQVTKPDAPKASSQPKGTAKTHRGDTPQKFGAFSRSLDGKAYLITKVNRVSVEYITLEEYRDSEGPKSRILGGKCEIAGLGKLKTPEQVKTEHPELLQAWERLQKLEKVRADIAAGRCPNFDDLTEGTRAKFSLIAAELARPVVDVFAEWFKWSAGDWKKTPAQFLEHLKQPAA